MHVAEANISGRLWCSRIVWLLRTPHEWQSIVPRFLDVIQTQHILVFAHQYFLMDRLSFMEKL